MDKIRFGVVGTNFITDWVIAGAKLDDRFLLTAVCSRTQERADAFAAKYAIPYTFTSLEEMAGSSVVDAIYIASPNFLHAEQSLVCMKHGKHVLCEKPFASNYAEALRMVEASEQYDVVLMEAMKPTLTPNFLSVLRNLHRVGKVRRYFSSYCQYSSRYDKFKEGVLVNAFNPSYSNGAVMDIGVYTIYPMIVLFGMPNEIIASGLLLSSGADAQGSVICKYDEMEATVLYSKITDSFLPTEIQGENGTITIDRINSIGKVTYTPHVKNIGGGKRSFVAPDDLTMPAVGSEYFYEVVEFMDLICSKKTDSLINSHIHSLNTMRILDEIRKQIGVHFLSDLQ